MKGETTPTKAAVEALLAPERRKLTQTYARAQRRWRILGTLAPLLYLALWYPTGAAERLHAWVTAQVPWPPAQVALAFLLVGGGMWVVNTVLAIPPQYLARRYGLSMQDWEHWLTDQVKAGLVAGVLGLIVLELMYALYVWTGPAWWFWAALAVMVILVLLTVVGPILIAPLFFQFTPLEDEQLKERLLALAREAGVPAADIYRFDMSRRTRAANAAVVGMGATRRILVADTLLEKFPPDEVEGVFAHELAHHVHRDIVWGLLLSAMLTLVCFRLLDGALALVIRAVDMPPIAPYTLPWLLFVLLMYSLLVTPLFNLWARSRETLADLFAIALTGRGTTYARALARLIDQNLIDLWPPRWYVILFASHPPPGERLHMALALGDRDDVSPQSQTPTEGGRYDDPT